MNTVHSIHPHMNYQIFNDPFPHVIIENTFDENQLRLIWREMEFLGDKLEGPENYSNIQEDGTYLTTAGALQLDNVYTERCFSDILRITQEVFLDNEQLFKDLLEANEYWKTYCWSNEDVTKIRRYYPGEEYRPHEDCQVHVIISTTLGEDAGGNLYFPKQKCLIETTNNKTVIFPGWIQHSITKVFEENRYAITKFVRCNWY